MRWLQAVIGAKQDGIVGNETLNLASAMRPADLINAYCDMRLAFVRRLSHFDTFGRGWTRRIAEVRAQALAWAVGDAIPESTVVAPGKAEASEQPTGGGLGLATAIAALIAAVAAWIGFRQ